MANRPKKFELSPRLKLGVGRGYSQNQILKISAIVCIVLAVALTFNTIRLLASTKNRGQAKLDNNAPQVLGATDTKNVVPSIRFMEYTAQKGDTLFNVSQKFQIDWSTLATLNDLKSPFTLKPGQALKIPKQ